MNFFKKIFKRKSKKEKKNKNEAQPAVENNTAATTATVASESTTAGNVAENNTATTTTTTTATATANIRDNLNEVIKGIQENRILEVFDKYYHDEIVMFEKGDSTNRVGKEANRKAEEAFVTNAKIHEARVLKTIVDGNNTAYEMFMDFTYGEHRIKKSQWAFQEWKDGKIIKEEFNDSNTTPATDAPAESSSSTEHNIKANLEAVIKGIQENKILEVFDKYYHDDIVMFEKGDSTNRIGKEANRKAEEAFVSNAVIKEARLLKTIVDGNNTAYEMFMDFTYGGNSIQKSQWAFQEWKDGKIIKEEFNDSNTTPSVAVTSTATPADTPAAEHDIKANLEAVIKGIQENKILEVFDQYYHDDIVMFEKGDSTNRIGKEANRKAEEAFVSNAVIKEARVLKTIIDGNNTAYEMFMDFTYGGNSIQKSQWAFQEWKDGKIIKEEFNDSNTTPAATQDTPAEHNIRANLEEVIKVSPAPSESPVEHDIKANLEAIIKGIQENRILEVFDKYYHDDIVMFEKGDSTNRVGKEANRKAEEAFTSNATIHEARVLKTIIDGNNTAYEMFMDFTYGGNKIQKSQWAFQEWSDGKIIKEEFHDSNTTPTSAPTEPSTPSTEHNIKANLEEVIKGIQENRILEVFDKYYHDDIVMFEKGDSTNRIGKEANRKAEEAFVSNAVIKEARVLKTIIDGNNTAYEMFMDFTYGGNQIQKSQWAFQEWKDGKIIKEEFNDSNTTPSSAPATTEESK
ncbi:hypothetical protein DICPUDRAFT_28055 [Dictyostelium purpureum]|uniref:SnoaL-like domain-containing protein n=1 Tax=Dictyostelium purpureum TaxID=5786 RepID=F0ZBA5_DICPU|nr:uncharacterized protein DICPUDRAFT_28055 [Dictyostelium purpureum]EGC38785.1 hypothetical protein DICPUDRAFT_28055 [Dictyostelium purpureum]|eukprot:XP_003284679.1 hypothetical protein DICPUDRAFT_28055 [Dictyostelium purpureum]